MIRKMLVIAAAVAMPASALAVGAIGGGVANAAKGPPPTPIVCAAHGTITFASGGISTNGNVTTAKTSDTTTSATTFDGPSCGTGGSTDGKTITSKNSKCTGTNTGTPSTVTIPGCAKKSYYYGTAASYISTGASTLGKALKKVTLNVNGISFAGKTKTATAVSGGACGSEGGFQLNGSVKASGQSYKTYSLLVCIGNDTGPGTTNAFASDVAGAAFGNTAIAIDTADIDPASSTLTIS
jgi:hypothetical protein